MQQAQPSLGRQLLGLAGTGVGIYGMGGGFKPGGQFSLGNIYSNVFGATGGGLSNLVKRQMSGRVGMSKETELTPEEIAFMRSRGVPASKLAIDPEALKTRRREAEAGVGDFPVTPSRETEEEARRQARQGPLQDFLRIRQESEGGVGDVAITPSLETEEEARRQARQRQLQNLLRIRQESEAGRDASDVGQRMNPALQRELDVRNRDEARRRQLIQSTQGAKDVNIVRDIGKGIASLNTQFGGEKRTSPNYLTGSRRPGQPRLGDKTFLDRGHGGRPVQ